MQTDTYVLWKDMKIPCSDPPFAILGTLCLGLLKGKYLKIPEDPMRR